MASGYGRDSTPNAELLNPRAQHVRCCACSLLRWGLRMYLSVLNIRSSSTDPGTITITDSATLTHSPNRYCAPKRVASPQNSLAERGVGGGGCAGSGSSSDSSLLQQAAAGLASSAAAAAAAARLGSPTHSFRPPPHHTANSCARAIPQGLDAQAIELETCWWAHWPLKTSHHIPP